MPSEPTFPHLMAAGRLGTMELRNRIIMCPMGDNLSADDGTISPNQVAYYEARARGGAALLLVGSVSVAYPLASTDPRQAGASHDRFLPGLADLTERAHRHGARIAAQLVHNGQVALYDVAQGRPMLVPSVPKPARPDRISTMVTDTEMAAMTWAYTQPSSRAEYKVATEDDIAWVIERFADAAERCQRAGFDGVELHAGHGYLIDEFLTPSLNTRTDGWGGPVEARARLLVDIVRALRGRLGDEFPLWARINAVEHHKADGERFEDQCRVVEMALDAGIDAVHLTAYGSTDVATSPTDSYVPHVVGPLADYSAALRARIDARVPLITFGRFEPAEAEEVLAAGKADFIAMGRKLLADPDLPAKLAAGRVDDVRPCIYQYRCIGNIFVREPLHCVANASTGREDDHGLLAEPARRPRDVLVVGGGPAGLEAARLLAGRGHRVRLWEASKRLGGMLGAAGRVDPLLERYLGWLCRQLEQSEVDIELGRRADAAGVAAAGAQEVVVATGAVWGRPSLVGADGRHVRTVPELGPWLDEDTATVGPSVAVLGGGKAGLSLADACLRRGRSVTVVEPSAVLGAGLGLPGRWRLVADLEAGGARLLSSARVTIIGSDAVTVELADGTEQVRADTVILASGAAADTTLPSQLGAAGLRFTAIGDCRQVGDLERANLDATAIALAWE